MTLRDDFKQVPVTVFDAMDDVIITGKLRQHVTTYAAGGGTTSVNTDYAIRLVEDTITAMEMQKGIAETGDRKFLTPVVELNVKPVPKDSVIMNTPEEVFNVYKVETDPAGALWALYTRQ